MVSQVRIVTVQVSSPWVCWYWQMFLLI